jgi:hypothetical protein
MSTLSFHADAKLEKQIRAEARRRKVSVSRFLTETVAASMPEREMQGADLFGLIKGTGTIDPHEPVLAPWNENSP